MKLKVNLSPNWILDTEMREYRPEEVDFASSERRRRGGVHGLQRLARAGSQSRRPRGRPPWHDTETQDGSATRPAPVDLYWNELRVTGGSEPLDPAAPTIAAAASAAARSITPPSVPASTPSDFRIRTKTASGRLADRYERPQALLRAHGTGDTRLRAALFSLGQAARLSLRPPPGRDRGQICSRAASAWASPSAKAARSASGAGRGADRPH